MTVYQPAAVILSEFTDESLRGPESLFGPQLRDLLLAIPAEFRQPAAAEQHHRSIRTTYVDTPGGRCAQSKQIRPALEVWREVIAEVARQVAVAGAR